MIYMPMTPFGTHVNQLSLRTDVSGQCPQRQMCEAIPQAGAGPLESSGFFVDDEDQDVGGAEVPSGGRCVAGEVFGERLRGDVA